MEHRNLYEFNKKKHAPSDGLFEQTYKLTYFCEELAEYAEKQLKSGKIKRNGSRTLQTCYKRDILHIKMLHPFCPIVSVKKGTV